MLPEGDAPPPLGGRRPLVADGGADVGLVDAGGRGDVGRLEGVLGQGRVRPLQGHARHLAGGATGTFRGVDSGSLEASSGSEGSARGKAEIFSTLRGRKMATRPHGNRAEKDNGEVGGGLNRGLWNV